YGFCFFRVSVETRAIATGYRPNAATVRAPLRLMLVLITRQERHGRQLWETFMGRFLIHRGTIALLVAITVSIIGFSLLRASGDLAQVLAGDNAKPEQIAATAHLYGLDKPLHEQYLDWAGKALSGDLGRSLFSNEPVARMIAEHIGVTVQL